MARFSISIREGIDFLKYIQRTIIEAIILSIFGKNMFFIYSKNPMLKYPAVTIFVRFDITKGFEALSPIKPPAIKKANMATGFIFKCFIFASKIGVRISAAPSFANKAATRAPSSRMYTNIRCPFPLLSLAILSAAHSKKPI